MASSADTPRARALGAEIRLARERRKLTTRQLGERIGRHSSHVSRWETGRLVISEADVATVLAVLGVTGGKRDELLQLAREAADPNWVAPGVDKQLAALTEYERTARTIIDVSPLLIPGLMQTESYARAMMTAFGATHGEAMQRAMLRIGRQHVLTETDVRLMAIVGEYALRHPPCSNEVKVGQLRRLLEISERDNVTLHVLPADQPAAPALTGPWMLIEFDRAKPVLHLEHYSSSATITDAKAITRYQAAADTLREVVMNPSRSRKFIADVIAEVETT